MTTVRLTAFTVKVRDACGGDVNKVHPFDAAGATTETTVVMTTVVCPRWTTCQIHLRRLGGRSLAGLWMGRSRRGSAASATIEFEVTATKKSLPYRCAWL